jgi:hypothetical protein
MAEALLPPFFKTLDRVRTRWVPNENRRRKRWTLQTAVPLPLAHHDFMVVFTARTKEHDMLAVAGVYDSRYISCL